MELFNLLANEVLHIRLNYGSADLQEQVLVGLAPETFMVADLQVFFHHQRINQSNARLIAGGGWRWWIAGHGSSPGGPGGGPSGGARY